MINKDACKMVRISTVIYKKKTGGLAGNGPSHQLKLPGKKIVPQLCVMVNLVAIANSNTNYKSIVDQSPCSKKEIYRNVDHDELQKHFPSETKWRMRSLTL